MRAFVLKNDPAVKYIPEGVEIFGYTDRSLEEAFVTLKTARYGEKLLSLFGEKIAG